MAVGRRERAGRRANRPPSGERVWAKPPTANGTRPSLEAGAIQQVPKLSLLETRECDELIQRAVVRGFGTGQSRRSSTRWSTARMLASRSLTGRLSRPGACCPSATDLAITEGYETRRASTRTLRQGAGPAQFRARETSTRLSGRRLPITLPNGLLRCARALIGRVAGHRTSTGG